MVKFIQTKYIIHIQPKEGRAFNPYHDEWNGREGGIIDVPIGERGWLFYKSKHDEYMPWHRIHLSIIKSVEEDDAGNIHIETMNTLYTLLKIHNTDNLS